MKKIYVAHICRRTLIIQIVIPSDHHCMMDVITYILGIYVNPSYQRGPWYIYIEGYHL